MKSQISLRKIRVKIPKEKSALTRLTRMLSKKHVIPIVKEYHSPTNKDSFTPILISKSIQTGDEMETHAQLTLRRFNIPNKISHSSERSILNREFVRPGTCSYTSPNPLTTADSRLNSSKLIESSSLSYLQRLISSCHSRPSYNFSIPSKKRALKKNTTERLLRSCSRPRRRLRIK